MNGSIPCQNIWSTGYKSCKSCQNIWSTGYKSCKSFDVSGKECVCFAVGVKNMIGDVPLLYNQYILDKNKAPTIIVIAQRFLNDVTVASRCFFDIIINNHRNTGFSLTIDGFLQWGLYNGNKDIWEQGR